MRKEKRTSLKDVANSIGVSTTLVSIVLNGKSEQYRIGEDMTKRVIAAAQEMNYSPNLVARNLRGGKTQLIGLIVTDISNPFFSSVARIIENRAKELKYTVVYGSSDENSNNTKQLIDVLLNKGVDGFIIVPCDGSQDIIKELHESGTPVVLIDRYFPEMDLSFSCLNNVKATELAVRHLIEQGYKNISLLAYKSQMSNVLDRIEGYESTMKLEGLSKFINIKYINITNPKPDVNKALEFLINKRKTEAIIFTTNTLSILGLYYMNNMNLRIPDDIAVIGFDGNDVFDLFYSPITHVEQPVMQIAQAAVNILIEKIKNSEQATRSMVIIEPELVIKESSLRKSI